MKFDYVVVGAGSAGCVVANRLSADPSVSVCLIEAGPKDSSPLIHMPFGVIGLIKEGKHNWGYNTEPQAALNKRSLYWPRGKTLGGSSSINGMVYIRGHRTDYDEWAAAGNKGWSWADLLPIFRAHEHNERVENAFHGRNGPLNVADARNAMPLSLTFIEAGKQYGLRANDDFNGATQEGVGLYQVTQKDGRRWSAAQAFLRPVQDRPNLTILTDTQATRILFSGKRATGVEAKISGRLERIEANREVVLCGGAINSPHLLMVSGVGPAAELKRHGIPLVHDLPGVGQNLQDHLDVTVMIHDRSRQAIGFAFSFIPRAITELFRYLFTRRGLFASNAAEAGAFIATPGDQAGRPGLQIHFIPSFLRDHGRTLSPGYGCTIHVCQLRPKSRGHIGLRSADPLAAPRIDPNYLAHPDDARELVAAVKMARGIFAAPAFRDINGGEDSPGPSAVTDEQIIADIRARAETIYHPVGSCKMGSDPLAVVDDSLRVHGVEGLRVADASIMPTLIGGNTNAPSMVIGEKAARAILGA